MDADQSFDEDDDEEDEEEETIQTSKKRPASSPAVKSQVCFTSLFSFAFVTFEMNTTHVIPKNVVQW